MYFEFNLGDLEEIDEMLTDIISAIYLEISVFKDICSNLPSYGETNLAMIEKYEEEIDKLSSMVHVVETFDKRVCEIIEAIVSIEVVEDRNINFIYDADQLEFKLNDIKEILSYSNRNYKMIFELSDTYTSWESRTTLKLDNPDANLLDSYEEIKQRDDEKVFRHNRDIMRGIDNKLKNIIGVGISGKIDNIDEIKEELERLSIIDEIEYIRDLFIDNIKLGSINEVSSDLNYITASGVDKYLTDVAEKDLINIVSKAYKVPKNSYDIFIAAMTDRQVEIFSEFFNVEQADEIVEVSIKYEKFEELLITNPKAIDEMWEFFDSVGVEGIYEYSEIEKLPKGWNETGRYLNIGGRIIDTVVFVDGVKSQDWSQVGGVLGGWGTELFIWACIPLPGNRVEAAFILLFSGYFGSKVGSGIGGKFE